MKEVALEMRLNSCFETVSFGQCSSILTSFSAYFLVIKTILNTVASVTPLLNSPMASRLSQNKSQPSYNGLFDPSSPTPPSLPLNYLTSFPHTFPLRQYVLPTQLSLLLSNTLDTLLPQDICSHRSLFQEHSSLSSPLSLA